MVWQARGDALTASVYGGGFTSDGRYLLPGDTHVFTLDPGAGRVVSAVRWPTPQPFTPLSRVWPDGRVSQADLGPPGRGLVLDPAHTDRGLTTVDGLVLAVDARARRALVVRAADATTEVRVVDTRNFADVSRRLTVPEFVRAAAWSPDGRQVALTSEHGIRTLDPWAMTVTPPIVGHSGAVINVTYVGRRHDLVWTAGRDGTAVGFDLSGTRTPITRRPVDVEADIGRSLRGGRFGVYLRLGDTGPNTAHVTDFADGRDAGELRYDVGRPLNRAESRTTPSVRDVALTPDGRRPRCWVSAGPDRTARWSTMSATWCSWTPPRVGSRRSCARPGRSWASRPQGTAVPWSTVEA